MRVAIFFTPAPDHPLTRAAAAWLMRDAFSGEPVAPVADPLLPPAEMRSLTAEPRRYGFHATLKAPFRLIDGCDLTDVAAATAAFARRTPAHDLPSLEVAALGPFFALTPGAGEPRTTALAAAIVQEFDRFRAPLSDAEIARRRPASLTSREAENLSRWGYPHVMDDFVFHMTLTGPVPVERQSVVSAVLARRFAPPLAQPVAIDALAIFVEPEPGAEFRVASRHPLEG